MIEIRRIGQKDDTASFACGNIELDTYLKTYARQNQFRHYIGTTYVAVNDEGILGYVSLSAGSIYAEEISDALRRKLPQYPLPILRLTRMAVDHRHQGRGIGRALLRFVFEQTLFQKTHVGCFGLVVDAKKESIGFYESFGFMPFGLRAGELDIRPFAQSMFLSTQVIERAMDGTDRKEKNHKVT